MKKLVDVFSGFPDPRCRGFAPNLAKSSMMLKLSNNFKIYM